MDNRTSFHLPSFRSIGMRVTVCSLVLASACAHVPTVSELEYSDIKAGKYEYRLDKWPTGDQQMISRMPDEQRRQLEQFCFGDIHKHGKGSVEDTVLSFRSVLDNIFKNLNELSLFRSCSQESRIFYIMNVEMLAKRLVANLAKAEEGIVKLDQVGLHESAHYIKDIVLGCDHNCLPSLQGYEHLVETIDFFTKQNISHRKDENAHREPYHLNDLMTVRVLVRILADMFEGSPSLSSYLPKSVTALKQAASELDQAIATHSRDRQLFFFYEEPSVESFRIRYGALIKEYNYVSLLQEFTNSSED